MSGIGKHFFPRFCCAFPLALALLFAAGGGRAATTRKNGDLYSIVVTTSREGASEVAVVRVTGRAGYHCNTLYPWKLTLASLPGVVSEKSVFGKKDTEKFSEGEVAFRIRYQRAEGAKTSAQLKFSVCNEKQCVMEAVDLRW